METLDRSILEVTKVSKVIPYDTNEDRIILKEINFQLKQGEFVAVMGPSGSGKSSLLYAVSGMDTVSSGTVHFKDEAITSFSDKKLASLRLNHMGFVFQHMHLLNQLNVFDNILLAGYAARKSARTVVIDRAKLLMNQIGISELSQRNITEVSGGQLQRVAICRALINEPDILFGDEPTGALNSKATEEVMNIFANIHEQGTSLLLVTHDVKVAIHAERVLYMLDGEIVAQYELGKYDRQQESLKLREKHLKKWLEQLDY
ncbi:ABC transporter ATP-binding protein [Paenibacillus endoradicis]|uniref:ABC transporter ATP-binding protein n=1 Tax=Paenibacillus endoradicis TaxID=2972487 RepID=UPI0021595F99|nr:ABC transporter ATP-binding protein [Paenibacillus endoradicis]MCR8657625.1 ABC transporter ATP-binding protein [Paenibacillus endoradicis]